MYCSHSAGSVWGINALPYGNRGMDIVECFYEGPFFSDDLTIAIGKIDFTGVFDASKYADNECGQFINAALVDDPTIPFPQQGLFEGRDNDVFGLAYAHGFFADRAASDHPEGYENVVEAYYNDQITPWFIFGPSIQYLTNPGGATGTKDATIFGLRAQMTF